VSHSGLPLRRLRAYTTFTLTLKCLVEFQVLTTVKCRADSCATGLKWFNDKRDVSLLEQKSPAKQLGEMMRKSMHCVPNKTSSLRLSRASDNFASEKSVDVKHIMWVLVGGVFFLQLKIINWN